MVTRVFNGRYVRIWTDYVEESAVEQISNLASLPFLYHHLAIMPDVHAGNGMPIGGVLPCQGVVIPHAVGADIGCGMCAVKSSYLVDNITREQLETIVARIRELVPVGADHHAQPQSEEYLPQGFDISNLEVVSGAADKILYWIGTLGGGNHFIELQRDEQGYLWVMIHSGSRQLGHCVGSHYNEVAQRLNRQWYSSVPEKLNLAFLPEGTAEFDAYWAEMEYCVEFALANRRLIMERIIGAIRQTLPQIEFEPMINIAHNYAAYEEHFGHQVIVHRKGATRAAEGVLGIIPGSQGTASYIVEGLGNPESFCSCSHGAGRVLSRNAARKELDLNEEIERLNRQGIIHSITTQEDLDEAAGAYKDIDTVMANQADLVRVVARLLPVAVIKGH